MGEQGNKHSSNHNLHQIASISEARKGLLQVLLQRKFQSHFSSTPIMEASETEDMALTASERQYLETLLEKGDVPSLIQAREKLADSSLFPDKDAVSPQKSPKTPVHSPRDSQLQQELFRLHERSVSPTALMQRVTLLHRNSILESLDEDDDDHFNEDLEEKMAMNEWISSQAKSFRILGTTANDTKCHPHVLSPPLMESIAAFCLPDEDTVGTNTAPLNFWLKYSMARDGPGIYTMLRHCRASSHTVLALETTTGYVLGAYCSQPWRLAPTTWYGGKDTFLWKRRQPRIETAFVDRACQESEIQVFPYRSTDDKKKDDAIQYCSKQCIKLGQYELLDDNKTGEHYEHALVLSSDLQTGSTSTSETFGNPCLIDDSKRGEQFEIVNLEVWTLTPHETVEAAEQAEFANMFGNWRRELSVMTILAEGGCGPCSPRKRQDLPEVL